jgi:hypothetical protein
MLEVAGADASAIIFELSEIGLFGFRRLGTCLLQSYAGPATVLVDELDTCGFKRLAYNAERSTPRLMYSALKLPDSYDPDA